VVLLQPRPARAAGGHSSAGHRPARFRRLGSAAPWLRNSRHGGGRGRILDALGIERATLVGHSFGSFVARQIAIAQPDTVDALVLIGTGYTAANPVTRDVQSSLRDLPDPIPLAFAREFQASTAYRPLPADFFEQIVAESMKLPPRLWRLAFESLLEYDDRRELERIEARTLLLWGDRDALFSRADQDRFMDVLPAARLLVYEDTGHCPNWEQPERIASDIASLVLRR
jgi:pimeloyl-ACP methyl ester carboxylesterase